MDVNLKNQSVFAKKKTRVYLINVFQVRGVFSPLSNIWDGAVCEIFNGFKPLTVNANSTILDMWQGSEYAYAV